MLQRPLKLNCAYQRYDWGTQSDIPTLIGLPHPGGDLPLAEYWMGAHPGLPSRVSETGIALNALIEKYPLEILGRHHARLHNALPYLFKVLSAARALSIQVHPNKEQAEAGFKKERAAGITPSSLNCNYKDDNHKPELLVALTPFTAMVGFRTRHDIAGLFRQLACQALLPWAQKLESDADALADLYRWLLYLDGDELHALCRDAIEHSTQLQGSCWPWIKNLHDIFGDDAGVLFPLLLNVFTLQVGQGVYLDAGIPHAYLQGTGLEVMASSDNVLRGGLTKKYMDREELIKITRFDAPPCEILVGQRDENRLRFEVPCPDFQFEIIEVDRNVEIGDSDSAELILILAGSIQLGDEQLVRGECALLPAALGRVSLKGKGKLARVTSAL